MIIRSQKIGSQKQDLHVPDFCDSLAEHTLTNDNIDEVCGEAEHCLGLTNLQVLGLRLRPFY